MLGLPHCSNPHNCPPLTIRFKQQYLSHRTLDIPTLMVGDTSNDLYQTRVILWSYFNIYWFIISWCYLSRDGDHNDGWGGEPYYCLVTTTHHNTTDNGWAGSFSISVNKGLRRKISRRTATSERKQVFACNNKFQVESIRKQVPYSK